MKTFEITRWLPEYPSEAILHVLGDLEAVEKSDTYVVDTVDCHAPYIYNNTMKCHVDTVGAYLAMSTNLPPDKDFMYYNISKYQFVDVSSFNLYINMLFSFDHLDYYHINYFLGDWLDVSYDELNRLDSLVKSKLKHQVSYNKNPKEFKSNMRKIAKILDKEGY